MKWLLSVILLVLISGCAALRSTYSYRAVTDNCNCEEFIFNDKHQKIEYHFRARYKMDGGVVTNIEVEFSNHSRDTLFLDLAAVKISSLNISYRYNDKFIPLPHIIILPSRSDVVTMTGNDTAGQDDWNKIAGEQLTITLKGLRLGEQLLPEQAITFVPENPKMKFGK